MSLGPFAKHAPDLAPGDRGVLGSSWDGFTVERVASAGDNLFAAAYARLWAEFGPRGEMERSEVIEDRLAWNPAEPSGGLALLYELAVVRLGDRIVAVRDHTAIVSGEGPGVVVHLSHALVEPEFRRTGLASWLRALPVETARRCAAAAGFPGRGITLVAEMEHDDGETAAVLARLRSYAKAGFRVVDPAGFPYCQPDFRTADEIDRTEVRPVPLCLVVRRVGREHEDTIDGGDLRGIVGSLHGMFALHARSDHMRPVRELASRMPAAGTPVQLLVPGATPRTERRA